MMATLSIHHCIIIVNASFHDWTHKTVSIYISSPIDVSPQYNYHHGDTISLEFCLSRIVGLIPSNLNNMAVPPSDINPTKEPPSNLLYLMRENDAYSPSIPRLYISQPFTGDKLDHIERNWNDWSAKMLITLTINGLKGYVKGTTICPSDSEPHAQSNWRKNDKLAFSLILNCVDMQELGFIDDTGVDTAKDCWDALEKRHMNFGPNPMRQLQLLREALSTRFSDTVPLHVQGAKLCNLVKKILAMGELTVDVLACIFILSSLSSFPHLQSIINHNISCSTKEKPYTCADIMRLLENEQRLLDADKARHTSTSTAPAARTVSKTTCANCKKTGHPVSFCISPGGGMAGKTIEESKKARREARDTKRNNSKEKIPFWVRDADGRKFIVYLDSA